MRMMRPGISTACLYPMEIERSLDLLLSMDFKLYEFFLNTWSELTPSFLRLLRDRLECMCENGGEDRFQLDRALAALTACGLWGDEDELEQDDSAKQLCLRASGALAAYLAETQ